MTQRTFVFEDYPRPYVESELVPERRLLREPCPFSEVKDAVNHIGRIRAYFDYQPDTGLLVWRQKNPNQIDRIATKYRGGTGRVRFDGFLTNSAKIVWLLHYGAWPIGRIGRRDDSGINDRIENLYDTMDGKPGQVARRPKSRGVARCGPEHWQAYTKVDGKQINLGRFKTEAEAIAARAAWDAQDVADLV